MTKVIIYNNHCTLSFFFLHCDRLLIKLEEIKKEFEGFWDKHEKRLNQTLLLREFEEEFKLVCILVFLTDEYSPLMNTVQSQCNEV